MITLLPVLVLVISAIPATRLCLQPALWAHYRGKGLTILAALAIYALLIITAWHSFPWTLPWAAAFAAIPTIFFWWRARPGYGVRKGLPTGSLSMVGSLSSIQDPAFYQVRGDDSGGVFKMSQFHRPTFCVTSIEKGFDLIRNNENKLSPAPMPFDRFIPNRFIRFMNGEDHGHYRKIFMRIFRPEIIDANRELIREASEKHLKRMYRASAQGAGVHPVDFMSHFTYDVFPAIFFGFKPGNEELNQLQAHYRRLDEFSLQHRYPDEIENILLEIEALILARAESYRHDRGNASRTSFLEELVHFDPEAVNDISLRRNLLYVGRMSRGDMTGFLNWVWYFMARNPSWLRTLRQESEPADLVNWRKPDSAVDRVIAEVLRMEQSEYLYREVLEDVHWAGFRIPKGWLLRVCIHEGHRNPDLFPNPDQFDPDRFISKAFAPGDYSPLGIGRHSCLGAHLVFSVTRGMLLSLATNYDVELINAGSRKLGGRHWLHWRQDETFAVRLHAP